VVLSYEEDPGTPAARSIAARIDLGAALREMGSHEEAIEAYLAALDIAEDVGRADDPSNGAAHWGIGVSAHDSGKFRLALEHQQRARDLAAKAGNAQLVRLGHFNVGRALTELGRHAEALASFEEAQAGNESSATQAEMSGWRARSLVGLGVQEYNDARYEEAVRHLGEANEIRARINTDELAARAGILWKLAASERRLGMLEDARGHAEEAIEFLTKADGDQAASLALPLEISAMILAEAKELDEARARARKAGEIRAAQGEKADPWNRAVKAVVLDFAGQPKKAVKWLKGAAKQAKRDKHPQYGTILAELASFLLRHGKEDSAKKIEARIRSLKSR
jgi:tetratricopeptide (TPR) repeat protein